MAAKHFNSWKPHLLLIHLLTLGCYLAANFLLACAAGAEKGLIWELQTFHL